MLGCAGFDAGEAGRGLAFEEPVAGLAGQGEGLPGAAAGLVKVVEVLVGGGQAEECDHLGVAAVGLLGQPQRLLVVGDRLLVPGQAVLDGGEGVEGVGLEAAVVAALVVLALAVPASARPAGPDSAATTAAVAASVPNCVVTDLDDSGYTDYLTVFNGCNYAVRVKVVLAFHTDKPCATIGAHAIRSYSWKYPGRFDGLASC